MALEAGISAAVIEAIRCHQEPDLVEPDQRVVYAFVGQLLRDRTVDQILYDQAVAALGERGLVDLVGIVGYYCLVSATLNVFDMLYRTVNRSHWGRDILATTIIE